MYLQYRKTKDEKVSWKETSWVIRVETGSPTCPVGKGNTEMMSTDSVGIYGALWHVRSLKTKILSSQASQE